MLPEPSQPADHQQQLAEKAILARLVPAGANPFADQLRIPQFGILHLLIWTTVTAVLLKIELAVAADQVPHGSPVFYLWMSKVWTIALAIVIACEFVGAGSLTWAKWHIMPRRLQPGHWLILLGALGSVFGLTLMVGCRLAFGANWQNRSVYHIAAVVMGLINVMLAGGYLLAAVLLRDLWPWKIVLATEGLVSIGQALFRMLSLVAMRRLVPYYGLTQLIFPLVNYLPALVVLVLIAAVVLDRSRRRSRDWVHWLGVSCLGLSGAMSIAVQVLTTLFVSP